MGKEEWITGADLVKQWKIHGFELIEYLRSGLQAYTKYGKRIIDRGNLQTRPVYSSIEEARMGARADDKRAQAISKSGHHRPLTEAEVESEAKRLLSLTFLDPSPPDVVVRDFSLPSDETKAQAMIDEAKGYLFKLSEAETFGQDHGLPPLLTDHADTDIYSLRPHKSETGKRRKGQEDQAIAFLPTTEDILQTLPKIAEFLGVSVETVKKRVQSGALKLGTATNKQRWAYRADLIKWKAEHLSGRGRSK